MFSPIRFDEYKGLIEEAESDKDIQDVFQDLEVDVKLKKYADTVNKNRQLEELIKENERLKALKDPKE
jgi:hypothetical protein